MFVKPRAGVNVRDPDSKQHIPAEGREVPESNYWLRRLTDGDVIVVDVGQITDSEPTESVTQDKEN
jgi:hypothetical protein